MAEEEFTSLPLNPLRAFAIASRHKTFTGAAQQMGVSQVAISRQISILENYLGAKLFERGARWVKLTELGRAFGQEIAPLFDELEKATQRVRSNERERTVHVRVYPTLLHYWLIPLLAQFKTEFPEYDIALDTAVEPLDFRGTHLDAAIQLGSGEWRDARSRKLFDETVDVVCSAAYAEQFDGFRDPKSLERALLLHAKYRRRAWEEWAGAQEITLNCLSGLEFNSSVLLYRAAAHGLGVAIGQIPLLTTEFQQGTLAQPLNRPVATGSAFHIVWPTWQSVGTKTKRFIDFVLKAADQKPEFFSAK